MIPLVSVIAFGLLCIGLAADWLCDDSPMPDRALTGKPDPVTSTAGAGGAILFGLCLLAVLAGHARDRYEADREG